MILIKYINISEHFNYTHISKQSRNKQSHTHTKQHKNNHSDIFRINTLNTNNHKQTNKNTTTNTNSKPNTYTRNNHKNKYKTNKPISTN